MTDYRAPVAAKFFPLPDGTPSSVQVDLATGRPVSVSTPQQLSDWNRIQEAMPPGPAEADVRLAKSMIRPLGRENAGDDTAVLGALRLAAEAEAATVTVEAPRTQAEHDARANTAAQLAARLGYRLVWVRPDDVMKVPAHLEVRDQIGTPVMAGDLVTLEKALSDLARERARRDAVIRQHEAYRARLAAERAEAIANLPENRLAALERKLTEAGIEV